MEKNILAVIFSFFINNLASDAMPAINSLNDIPREIHITEFVPGLIKISCSLKELITLFTTYRLLSKTNNSYLRFLFTDQKLSTILIKNVGNHLEIYNTPYLAKTLSKLYDVALPILHHKWVPINVHAEDIGDHLYSPFGQKSYDRLLALRLLKNKVDLYERWQLPGHNQQLVRRDGTTEKVSKLGFRLFHSLLTYEIINNNRKNVRLLLENGADPNAMESMVSPLYQALSGSPKFEGCRVIARI